jgi:hypothetical protein
VSDVSACRLAGSHCRLATPPLQPQPQKPPNPANPDLRSHTAIGHCRYAPRTMFMRSQDTTALCWGHKWRTVLCALCKRSTGGPCCVNQLLRTPAAHSWCAACTTPQGCGPNVCAYAHAAAQAPSGLALGSPLAHKKKNTDVPDQVLNSSQGT